MICLFCPAVTSEDFLLRKFIHRAVAMIALLLMSLYAPGIAAQAQPQSNGLLMGAAWYPEQWPESRWDADLQLMEQAHVHVVRVGEFAWSRMEPREGVYDFGWLERAVRMAERHHIAVVMGTPTDAPPAWLTSKYPDTLRVDANGKRAEHGERRQFSYSSPHYREFCVQIATELAQHFGHDPNVIGWQIGNEFTDESFDAGTRVMFQQWLHRKYGTLDALNQHWTTAYWSQTYDRWDEIPLAATRENPGLLLDHRHFVTATWQSFQHAQLEAIRKYASPRQFITTNIGGLGWSDNFDHYRINDELDLAAWDDYVGQGHLHAERNAMMHDFVRGWKRKNFWVMETQPGFVNWAPVNNSLNRGETRVMAWQAVGHGADAVLYWQWRSALNGQEQYHGAIVGPDGTPLPIYSEVQQIGTEFDKASAAMAGTHPVSDVAILHTYDSRWAIDFQPQTREYDQQQVMLEYYRPLHAVAQSVDVVEATAPLSQYKLVVAPSLNVISPQLAAHLLEYVRGGGHLVLGPRSGMKDAYDALNIQRQPGPLVDALGGRVEQFYALESTVPVMGALGAGTAHVWAEQLSTKAPDTHVLLRYGKSNGWLDGQPAIIERSVGRGTLTYIGALLDAPLMKKFMVQFADEADVKPFFGTVPEGVEVCRRVAASHEVFVVINHGTSAAEVKLPGTMQDLLRGTEVSGTISIPANDLRVLEQPTGGRE
ncbi:MAG: beta-galactosidase [Acidobacteriaceae bacterium]